MRSEDLSSELRQDCTWSQIQEQKPPLTFFDLSSKNPIWKKAGHLFYTIPTEWRSIVGAAIKARGCLSEAGTGVIMVRVRKNTNGQSHETLTQSSQGLSPAWSFMFLHDKEPKHSRDDAGVRYLCQRCPWVTQTERWLKPDQSSPASPENARPTTVPIHLERA